MNVSTVYQAVVAGIIVLFVSWIGAWIYRRFIRKKQNPKSEQYLEGATQSATQIKMTGSTVNGPIAGRDINIGNLMQVRMAATENADYHERPTPTEITKALGAVAVYVRESVAATYVGIKVHWRAKIDVPFFS
jgi:hypothetical protein